MPHYSPSKLERQERKLLKYYKQIRMHDLKRLVKFIQECSEPLENYLKYDPSMLSREETKWYQYEWEWSHEDLEANRFIKPVFAENKYVGVKLDFSEEFGEMKKQDIQTVLNAIANNPLFAAQVTVIDVSGNSIRSRLEFPSNLINLQTLLMEHLSSFHGVYEPDHGFFERGRWDGVASVAPNLSGLTSLIKFSAYGTYFSSTPELPSSLQEYTQEVGLCLLTATIPNVRSSALPNLRNMKLASATNKTSCSTALKKGLATLCETTGITLMFSPLPEFHKYDNPFNAAGIEDWSRVTISEDLLEKHFNLVIIEIGRQYADFNCRYDDLKTVQSIVFIYMDLVVGLNFPTELAKAIILMLIPKTRDVDIIASGNTLRYMLENGDDERSAANLNLYLQERLPEVVQVAKRTDPLLFDSRQKITSTIDSQTVTGIIQAARTRKLQL